MVKDNDEESKSNLKNRQFFCSELITKCYKELNLLKTDRASVTHTPQDLSATAKNPFKLEGTNYLCND